MGYVVVVVENEFFENASRPAMIELIRAKIIERLEAGEEDVNNGFNN